LLRVSLSQKRVAAYAIDPNCNRNRVRDSSEHGTGACGRVRFNFALAKHRTLSRRADTAVCGVPSQPNVFYMAPVNGGVFKSIDYGRTWQPIFDDQPTASIGAIAVAPSNPNVVYVGSGEGLHRPDLSGRGWRLQID
jgi:hypothetical protein